MSWINMTWQDPEEGQVYDVWSSYGKRFTDYKWQDGKWISVQDGSWLSINITHFMPSPEPPKD